MENEKKDNSQQDQKEQNQNQQNKEEQNQDQSKVKPNSQYAGTTQGGQGAPAQDGVKSSDGRNTTIDTGDEHSIAGRQDS